MLESTKIGYINIERRAQTIISSRDSDPPSYSSTRSTSLSDRVSEIVDGIKGFFMLFGLLAPFAGGVFSGGLIANKDSGLAAMGALFGIVYFIWGAWAYKRSGDSKGRSWGAAIGISGGIVAATAVIAIAAGVK